MGLSTSVNIAASGLKVTQTATSLVSANIAGASVDGFTAKKLNTQALYADTGLVGFSTSVTRAFDQEVFDQLVGSTATTSYLDVKNTYLEQIDQLIGSTENGAALPTVLASFTTQMQTLAAQPDSAAARIEAVNSAVVVAQTLNSLSSTVTDLQNAVDEAISEGVDKINALTKTISDLNDKMVELANSSADTTGLQDARDQAVLELATYVDVQVKPQSDGTIRVTTANGLTLVDNAHATPVALDARGQLRVDDGKGSGPELISSGLVTSGSLAGLFELRDTILPQVQNQFDQIAAGLASTLSDTTTAGTAATSGAQAGFTIDVADLEAGNKVSLTYTDGVTGDTKTVTFVRVDDPSVLPLSDDATIDPNDTVFGIDFSGTTASVATQMQTALGANFTVSNPSGTTIRVLDDGAGAVSIGALSKTVTQTDPKSGNTALALFTDGSGYYTGNFEAGSQLDGFAGRITVNAAIKADPSLMVDYTASTATGDSTRPSALYDALVDTKLPVVLGNGTTATTSTISRFANSMVSYWAAQAETQQSLVDGQSVVQANLRTRMSDASAVSTDSELAKLIQLQSYYSANAQVLSTLREMLDTLVKAI